MIILPIISLPPLYIYLVKGWENVIFGLWSETVEGNPVDMSRAIHTQVTNDKKVHSPNLLKINV